MRRGIAFILVILCVLLASGALRAQTPAAGPDYVVSGIRSRLSDDSTQMIIEFEVQNSGANADTTATVDLVVTQTGQRIATTTMRALRGGEIVTVRFTFPVNVFPPCTQQSLYATVGIGEIEVGSPTMENNSATIDVIFPDAAGQRCAAVTPQAGASLIIPIPGTNLQLDLGDPAQTLPLVGAVGAGVLLLVVVVVILRAGFQRTPAFGTMRPPYATLPPGDANTISGRRHLWQQHAQNGTLPAGAPENSIHARKLLLGVDGRLMSGWSVKAVRISQYDAYGRVAHSQVLAPDGMVRRLDRALRQSARLKREQALRQLRPLARYLVERLKRRITTRGAALPIALDVRFEGRHGEVRILFELYQIQSGQYVKLDGWEPEMVVLGKIIHESFTYTLNGQLPGEALRDFKQRLSGDAATALTEVLFNTIPVPPPAIPPDTAASPTVQDTAPTTPPPLDAGS